MKQQILIIILLLDGIFFSSASGQDTKFTIAAEGGPSLTNLYGNNQSKKYFKPIVGGYAGILVQYNFSQYFSLRSGLTYERTGTNFLVDTYDVNADCIYRFDYVTIPVLFRAQYGTKVRFYINAGPYFSYLCNQQYLAKKGKKYDDITSEVNDAVPMNKNRTDYGIVGGLGIEIKIIHNASITIGVTDFLGLCNTKKQPPFTTATGEDLGFTTKTCNNSAIFHVGFSVDIGKTKQ